MPEHVAERDTKKGFFKDELNSPVTSEPSIKHLTLSKDLFWYKLF